MQAMVDVISSQGWLTAAQGAMDLSQMLVQGQWESDSPLLQLPHMAKDLAARCDAAGCPDIIALQDMKVRPPICTLSPFCAFCPTPPHQTPDWRNRLTIAQQEHQY